MLMHAPPLADPLPDVRNLLHQLRGNGMLPWKPGRYDYYGCLAPLLESLGWGGNSRQLYDALPHHGQEFHEVDFYNIMAMLGYRYQTQQVRNLSAKLTSLPALYFEKGSSSPLYVLQGRNGKHIQCYDAINRRNCNLDMHQLNGRLVTFEKIVPEEDEAERHARTKTGVQWFQSLMRNFDRVFWYVAGLSVVINLMSLAVPIFVMVTYDKVIGASSLITLPYLLVGILGAIAFEGVLRLTRTRLLAWFGARINMVVSVLIFERLLFLPPSQTERAPIASQLARIKAFETVRDFFTGSMFVTLLELPFVLVLIFAIGMIAGPLAWIAASVTLAYIALITLTRWSMKLNIHRAARAGSQRMQLAMETFSKLDSLKYNGVVEPWLERYQKYSSKSVLNNFKSSFLATAVEHIAHALTLIAGVATLAFGVDAIWQGQLSAGGLVAIMILTWRVLSPLQNTCAMMPRLEHVRSSIDQVNQLMELKAEREPVKPDLVYKPFKGAVAFQNVGLRYGRFSDPVFTSLSLNVKPGEIVAITGGNGTGKSSILKLVAGLYTPQAGTIRIDGTDSRQLDPIVLRRQISYMPQNPDFFGGTLADNLRLHRPDASEEMVKHAMQQADAWQDVQQLPAGINTRIGSNHLKLTSGLAYRLGLARLYLNPSSIILCDELPYALLNGNTGEEFLQQLAKWRGNHTIFFVTHRSDYLQMANHVILLRLDHRPIIGTPAEVLNKARNKR